MATEYTKEAIIDGLKKENGQQRCFSEKLIGPSRQMKRGNAQRVAFLPPSAKDS
jgi:hypothetical protein